MKAHAFPVTGMTCDHCASAVTSELKELPGVMDVNVQLVAGGTSMVTIVSDAPIDQQDVAATLHEAGDYQLAETDAVGSPRAVRGTA